MTERFEKLVEHCIPFPLNGEYDIELSEEQNEFLRKHHFVLPVNTTIMVVSLDELVNNYTYDKNRTIDNTILELTDGLLLTPEDRTYLTSKLVSKIMC